MNDMNQKHLPDGEWRAFATAAFGGLTFVLTIVAIVIVCLLSGCTTTRYVEVPGPSHTEVRHTRDTVEITDTLIDHRETIIREADSATLAKFGIQISGMEKAWLIQTQQLQREINRLKEAHSDTVHVTDSVPYPVEVPVEKLVEKELTWWQQQRMQMGDIAFVVLGIALLYGVFKLYRKIKP
jgi:hypothetical protein